MVESYGQDVQVPWFSGLCLEGEGEGEVAGQYEMERSGSQREDQDTTKAGLLELDGLAPITIFVGANNSGKSRLMRELFKKETPVRFKLKSRDAHGAEVDIAREIESVIHSMGGEVGAAIMNGWIGKNEIVGVGSQRVEMSDVIAVANIQDEEIVEDIKSSLSRSGITDEIRGLSGAKRCYVPILRGMRPPMFQYPKGDNREDERHKDLYAKRTAHEYFTNVSWTQMRLGSGLRNIIFTGLSLYDDLIWRLLGRTQAERDSVRVYENFFSENFFPGQSVVLIPVMEGNNDVVHIKIGNNKEYPIYDLGDGMQSLIICTYPIVTETEPGSLFFLEEPDLCMHPSLQRTFVEVLKTYHRKRGHQFFITTHSNHLLDLLEDNELVSIFSFSEIADQTLPPVDSSLADSTANSQSSKPKPSFRIRPSNLRDRQTLLELGVRPSATYLANATIWVEGVSDCAYLRAYMEAFVHYLDARGNAWGISLANRLSKYKEDRHYAFVEYSGSNLQHYSFTDKGEDSEQAEVKSNEVTSVPDLCARAIVIADGDIGDPGKGDRKESFADQLGDRFIWLPGKEIENMIPEALMREQVRRDIPKNETTSQRSVDRICYQDYYRSETGVGAYLYDLGFIKPKYKEDGSSGTLSSHMKGMWASNHKGIPWLVRQDLKRDNKTEDDGGANEIPPNVGNLQSNDELQIVQALPSYLTQDLIWLCVCLYVHIAKCNHDQETEQKLKEFQQFIRDQGKDSKGYTGDPNDGKQPGVESENLAESAAPEWPIQDVERNCLLKAFLRSNNAESTPSLNAEPNPASTSSATGTIASPASLNP